MLQNGEQSLITLVEMRGKMKNGNGKRWCWDDPGGKPFGWDKWEHFACYFVFAFFAVGLGSRPITVLIAGLIIGIAWEYLELTDIWDRICRSWIGRLLHLGGKATCCSLCDLIWNIMGMIAGVLGAYCWHLIGGG